MTRNDDSSLNCDVLIVGGGPAGLSLAASLGQAGLSATLLTHFLAERMRSCPRVVRVLEKTAGTFLIGFGIKLAISK